MLDKKQFVLDCIRKYINSKLSLYKEFKTDTYDLLIDHFERILEFFEELDE